MTASMTRPVLRFAPSPNGELHLGHALSALTCHEMARRSGGRFLLRIEDIDVARCRPSHVEGIFQDLAWLGITWEQPVLHQSRHFADYAVVAAQLETMGLVYPCFATRSEIMEAARARPGELDPEGSPIYPGLYKALDLEASQARRHRGEPFALRLDMERALHAARAKLEGAPLTFTEIGENGRGETVTARPERWGDCILVRKDVPASYLLAATFDDARQGVTHVVRGRDLYAATDLQRLLQVLMGWPEPVYHHHRLIVDGAGRKLSKSARDTSLASLRSADVSPEAVRERIGFTPLRAPWTAPR